MRGGQIAPAHAGKRFWERWTERVNYFLLSCCQCESRTALRRDRFASVADTILFNGPQQTASMCDSSRCEIRDARSRPKRSQHCTDGSHLREGLCGCPLLFGAQAIPERQTLTTPVKSDGTCSESNKGNTTGWLTTHRLQGTSSTLLRAIILAESKVHQGNWLEDCKAL